MIPFITIIVPLYNEELVIDEMYKRLEKVLNNHNSDYEIIFVNDGSRDETLKRAKEICKKNMKVKLISFSRNFGHQIAITAGMDKSKGQVVVIIDADLQDPPEIIIEMIKKWQDGYQVVYGIRKARAGESKFKIFSAFLFYRILDKLTDINIPLDAGDFRLMDRKIVEVLKNMRERNRFVRGMVSWVGFKQCKIEYEREPRFAGETKYPLKRMFNFALDGIISFSKLPLKLSSFFGLLCAGVSVFFIIYGILLKLFFPEAVIRGWTSVFVAILFVGGVQMISIGIIGEYLGRIYEEIKSRPIYISDEEINFE